MKDEHPGEFCSVQEGKLRTKHRQKYDKVSEFGSSAKLSQFFWILAATEAFSVSQRLHCVKFILERVYQKSENLFCTSVSFFVLKQ